MFDTFSYWLGKQSSSGGGGGGGGVTQKKTTISLKPSMAAVVQEEIDKMPKAVLIDVNGGKVTWQ